MSNNYNRNTVRLKRDKYSVRSASANTSHASRVYNYELMLQLYYIARQQEAAPPKHLKMKNFLAGVSNT